jgi:hypothetical protein
VRRGLLAALTLAILLLAAGSARAAFTHYSPPDPQKVDFVVKCNRVTTGTFDPIVMPGMSMAHRHEFYGAKNENPSSDEWSQANTPTSCGISRDPASYWKPIFSADGNEVFPGQLMAGGSYHEGRFYYRAGTTDIGSVQPIPFGLRIIAGNASATSWQSASIAGFQCRDDSGNTVGKQAKPPDCPKGDFLEPSVVFPNCWDGVHLDSADHKAHMSYASPTAKCDAAHGVRLPQVTLAWRYPTDAFYGKKLSIATLRDPAYNQMTLHADILFAWDPATMRELVKRCIQASIGCEDVSDGRLPPSMNGKLPPAEWPTPPPKDDDKDDVPNTQDNCPMVAGPPSNGGCPLPVDSDGDGVTDPDDACVSVFGTQSNGCPIPDTDGDNVTDAEDKCISEPGPASNNGCPEPVDSDGDGVFDDQDACKDTWGTQTDGCPVPDTDGDTVPDETDQCKFDSGPAPSGCPPPLPIPDVSAEGESMTLDHPSYGSVVNDVAAYGGKAMKFNSPATGKITLTVPRSQRLDLVAKAQLCNGSPKVTVRVDGSTVFVGYIDLTTYVTIPIPVSISAGEHTLSVYYMNDYKTTSCDRNVIVDRATVLASG